MRTIKVIHNPFEYEFNTPAAVTIGKFDGLHLGHRELIREAVRLAKEERAAGKPCVSAVLSFDMAPAMILTPEERCEMLAEMGVDVICECEFGPHIIGTPAEDFVRETLAGRMHAVHVVTGEDFRFGYQRQGDTALLEKMGSVCGFAAHVAPTVHDPVSGKKISSTMVREALLAGKMERTADLLGYPYFVTGEIIHGRQVGRTIGIPTANLKPARTKLLPPNGVYYSRSTVIRKETGSGQVSAVEYFHGATDIGTKPTVNGQFIGVETFFYDCAEDLYGESLKTELLHFARPEMKFESLDALKAQITSDAADGRKYFGE